MPNLIEIIKQAAVEAVTASNPCRVLLGEVISTAPLKVRVEQRLTLEAPHLILSTLVQNFEVDMTVEHFTENDSFLDTTHSHPFTGSARFDSAHGHAYKGRKKFLVHLGLKVGETVMLVQAQGGQKYIVLDRVRT